MFSFAIDPGLFVPILVLLTLAIAAVCDAETGQIPMFLFPVLWALCLPLTFFSYQFDLVDSVVGCLIGVGVFFVLAIFFDGGGGDILMIYISNALRVNPQGVIFLQLQCILIQKEFIQA